MEKVQFVFEDEHRLTCAYRCVRDRSCDPHSGLKPHCFATSVREALAKARSNLVPTASRKSACGRNVKETLSLGDRACKIIFNNKI